MWNQNGFILVCLGMFLSVTRPSLGSHGPFQLNCGLGRTICGQEETKTLQNICGGDFGIHLYGITDESMFTAAHFPFNLTAVTYIENEQGAYQFSVLIDRTTGDDLTSAIPTGPLNIPDGECKNTEFSVFFELSSADGSKMFKRSIRRRMWSDFSGYNLKMDTDIVGTNMPVIQFDDTVNTLADAMTAFTFTVSAAFEGGEISEIIPTSGETGPVPAGVYGAAYITPDKGLVVSRQECETMENPQIPEIFDGDMVVSTELYQTNAELQALSLYSSVKGNDVKLDLCGEHLLILMLDPMRTLWNEPNVCDNYLAFRINSTQKCDTVPPKCDVIRNAWTGDLRAMYRGADQYTMSPFVKVFDFEGSAVTVIHDDPESFHVKKAYGRLRIIENFIDKYLADHATTLCPSDTDLVAKLTEIEGSSDDSDETASFTLPTEVTTAKEKMEMLRSGSADVNSVKTETEAALVNIETKFSDNSNVMMIKKEIAKRALESVQSTVDNIINGGSVDDMNGHYCDWFPGHLEHSRWALMGEPDLGQVLSLAGNVASAFVSKREFSCLENLLKRFIKYATELDTTGNPDTTFFFDTDDIANEDDLGRCGKANKCIKKIHRACEVGQMENVEPISASRDEICKLYVMKTMARSQYKSLTLEDLYYKFKEDEIKDGKQCARDPLRPNDVPPVLWRQMVNETTGRTYLSKGVPISDTEISWRKVAVCSCKPCESDYGSWTDWANWANTGYNKKRRRRK